MPTERKFNLYTPRGYVGTFTVAELRQMVLDGRVPRGSMLGEVRAGIFGTRQRPPVSIKELPELADLEVHLTEPEPEVRASSLAPATTGLTPEPDISRRSVWATVLRFLGVFTFLCGLLVAAFGHPVMGLAMAVVGAIQAFFLAFLVDVFTDIRWYLKKLLEK